MQYYAQVRKKFLETRFCSSISGNIAVMTALTMPVALILAAVAVDEASLYAEKREAQSLVDIAAITAAANLSKAETAVTTTFRDNGVAGVVVGSAGTQPPVGANGIKPTVTVTPGRYVADASAAVGTRFAAGVQPYNSVKVTFKKSGKRYFGGALIGAPTIATQATASVTPQAAFSIGSRLASVDEGILNSLLSGLTGSNLSLKVMDYNALISADVSVLSFFDALATKLQITAGTYTNVLNASATVGQIVSAMASIDGIGAQAKLALQTIASGSTNQTKIPLSHLFDLGPVGNLSLGSRPAGLTAAASIMEILTASAALANGSNQAGVNLTSNLLDLLSTELKLAIGEPPQSSPWFKIGETGSIVRTAQTRLRLIAGVNVGIKGILGGGIRLASVQLPLHVKVAYGEAKVTGITCPTGRPESIKVTIAARPGIATLKIAETDDAGFGNFTKPTSFRDAKIADVEVKLLVLTLPLIAVTGSAGVDIGNLNTKTLTFDYTDIKNKTIKQASAENFTQTLTQSLINDLKLKITALGLPIDVTVLLGVVKQPILNLLGTITAPVDNALYTLLTALGVHVGQADIRVTGATCGNSVLVQ
ncbi:hypothetical protein G6N74_05670 [Mesorhizobium sp. CGMCC 1.15528]|uniref:Putative Flp pilus-assembly TadG-like N-terminal domain-containing protein n=1 Tax=Mesorhizobium zhangyense TaxID=1776730 RepID=A0A7C9V7H9_9HYPH|nr:TadG family pilus assembly protein [Mesorhizobium zhangyense]NGN40546.1 hypothetical protein [Mesorhizobium zhangyense]